MLLVCKIVSLPVPLILSILNGCVHRYVVSNAIHTLPFPTDQFLVFASWKMKMIDGNS